MKLTPGKFAGLKKVSNEHGVIAAAAMDQRGSLQKSLAKEKGGEITDAMMEEFKTLVTEVLTPHATAILSRSGVGIAGLEAPRQECRTVTRLRKDRIRQDRSGPFA